MNPPPTAPVAHNRRVGATALRIPTLWSVPAALLLVACVDSGVATDAEPAASGRELVGGATRVVVSNGGGGVNIYHEIFRQGGPIYGDRKPNSVTPDVLAEFGIGEEQIIDLTITGDPEADYATDRERLNSTAVGKPHWIRDTNLIIYPGPSLDDSAHFISLNAFSVATRSTSDILLANPDAIIVFVENDGNSENRPLEFEQPSVDINAIYTPFFSAIPDAYWYDHAYQGAVRRGKMAICTIAANAPLPYQLDFGSSSWWMMTVGYFDEDGTNGKEVNTPVLPDFTADFTLTTPEYCSFCQTGYAAGNVGGAVSNYAAGVVSAIILKLRQRFGHVGGIRPARDGLPPALVEGDGFRLTNWQLRRALEETAAVPGIEDFEPGNILVDNSLAVRPSVEQAPWLSVGWGLLSTSIIDDTVEYILAQQGFGGDASPRKGPDQCAVMTASMELRMAWSEAVRTNNPLYPDDPVDRTELYQRCSTEVDPSL